MAKTRNKNKHTKKSSSSSADEQEVEELATWINGDNISTDNPKLSITQKSFTDIIKKLKEDLSKEISNAKTDIISQLRSENENLRSDVEILKTDIKDIKKRLIKAESENLNLQQYVRRNNIEICGIPDDIEIENLESKVIEIADSIGVELKEGDIEACHRLKKGKKDKTARTIVRFLNRKNCDKLHQNKKKLGNKSATDKLKEANLAGKIFINCNLAPYSKFLWSSCKKLYDEKLIDRFWVFNGSVYIAINENNIDVHTKIEHLNTLEKIFPGYDFHTF